jgi:hypothetical protein
MYTNISVACALQQVVKILRGFDKSAVAMATRSLFPL